MEGTRRDSKERMMRDIQICFRAATKGFASNTNNPTLVLKSSTPATSDFDEIFEVIDEVEVLACVSKRLVG